jgi:hypothetical protein
MGVGEVAGRHRAMCAEAEVEDGDLGLQRRRGSGEDEQRDGGERQLGKNQEGLSRGVACGTPAAAARSGQRSSAPHHPSALERPLLITPDAPSILNESDELLH